MKTTGQKRIPLRLQFKFQHCHSFSNKAVNNELLSFLFSSFLFISCRSFSLLFASFHFHSFKILSFHSLFAFLLHLLFNSSSFFLSLASFFLSFHIMPFITFSPFFHHESDLYKLLMISICCWSDIYTLNAFSKQLMLMYFYMSKKGTKRVSLVPAIFHSLVPSLPIFLAAYIVS